MLVYDGECSFCCRCASWVTRRADINMSPGTAQDLERLGLSSSDAKRAVWWIEGDVRLSGHHRWWLEMVRERNEGPTNILDSSRGLQVGSSK